MKQPNLKTGSRRFQRLQGRHRVWSAFQTGRIFHHVVKNLQHSASQRFTVNVKDYITTCCGPKALREAFGTQTCIVCM